MEHASDNDPPRRGAGRERAEPAGRARFTVDSGSLFTGIGTLCATAVRLTGADGAAVAVLSSTSQARELVYATDATAQQIDELQFVIGEGPCLDSYRHAGVELWPDLGNEVAAERWPAFVPDALAIGVRAAFAFPLLGRRLPIGVLELYRSTVGELDSAAQESAAACASAVAGTLSANWAVRVQKAGGVEQAIELSELEERAAAESEFSRTEVYIAAGMVAVQLAVPSGEGLDRLRAYAYAQRRSIAAVAADIVARRLSLRGDRDRIEGEE
ncbi:GAF domain-containing protein [Nocardia ninae]|uniref:GAF domain-containing protein n=1 Tax=Nocardia ninae NBRC 108245 TaxID=1210091 RepID=A0A511M6C6_9NOCA|nr:GAF domain-containing protein [Nocardia ninae]GEM36175.1 GAF domain-containing protein [Nocardia ninae NBRC 108245]